MIFQQSDIRAAFEPLWDDVTSSYCTLPSSMMMIDDEEEEEEKKRKLLFYYRVLLV